MSKIKINRNILWAEALAEEFVKAGIDIACISPGSRNTPLTYVFATNRNIKSYSIIDERSCGFFSLGIAKSTKKPVVIICTSGTATAELYPAIIEAYQSKVPLIICTADRPPELQNVGANQTINQNNLYKNHICWFADAGLPQVTRKGLDRIKRLAQRALFECTVKNSGPVHINFPFKKPFEPNTSTDEISLADLKFMSKYMRCNFAGKKISVESKNRQLRLIAKKISNTQKGIIVVGWDNYSPDFFNSLSKLAVKIGYPIFADAASNMRFGHKRNPNVIINYDSYLRSEKFVKEHQPRYIIQFGRNFSSKALSNFIADSHCEKLLVNKFGEWKNAWRRTSSTIAYEPEDFCNELSSLINTNNHSIKSIWLPSFLEMDKTAEKIKNKIFERAPFPNETKIISELIDEIPRGSNLMISNSLPIRDFDLISGLEEKKINVYHNRGASGIDGIISTALGIAKSSKAKTYLIIGDLAFYYDMNSLFISKKYGIPLTIILINNNGGRIFEILPISDYREVFETYFATPHNLNFSNFIKAFEGNYFHPENWNHYRRILGSLTGKENFSVIEFKTNSKESLNLRRKYYDKVISAYNKNSKKLL